MHNHEPAGYDCPFCFLLAGGETPLDTPRDIVLRTAHATAFTASRWWPNNHGNVLVIPNAHHENLYDLPAEYGHAVHDVVREVAVAMRATYGCAGVSTRQHNEPAGGQDVWHYHVHVFPRYHGDDLYMSRPLPGFVPGEQRWAYTDKLRDYFGRPAGNRSTGGEAGRSE
ncbi:HIT family protein [Nocardia sp. NPDC057668]|uniref:HIT family protein n=1 Tax=Nocardia sp. NPDC057668 TaxID=3346202 RepID=UPI00367319D2